MIRAYAQALLDGCKAIVRYYNRRTTDTQFMAEMEAAHQHIAADRARRGHPETD